MGKRIKKKYQSGAATNFVSRREALKTLQLSLKDFRRLCIIKGIYPHEPNKKKKVNKGSTENKTWYYAKDILFLQHEPILQKFREHKIFARRLRKALAKKELEAADRLRENKPSYKLDHIVKERYPTIIDAVRDLDDALCLCFLYCRFAKSFRVKSELVQLCRRLTVEFMHYVIAAKALKKVFVSIKGIYYQADVLGQPVTWIVPHERGLPQVSEVDFSVMATFAEFYSTMLGFVNYKLFCSMGLHYPPKLSENRGANDDDDAFEVLESLNQSLHHTSVPQQTTDVADEFAGSADDEHLQAAQKVHALEENLPKLFVGKRFFLNREVPRESLTFILRACGGEVSWDAAYARGATFSVSDASITHQIVDRPTVDGQQISRWYVQPQWVYDCINKRSLLPVKDYFVGTILPPHLSPFVEEVPSEPPIIAERPAVKTASTDVRHSTKTAAKEAADVQIRPGQVNPVPRTDSSANEELKLREMMIPKRYKQAYKKMKFGEKRRAKEAAVLETKRRLISTAQD